MSLVLEVPVDAFYSVFLQSDYHPLLPGSQTVFIGFVTATNIFTKILMQIQQVVSMDFSKGSNIAEARSPIPNDK